MTFAPDPRKIAGRSRRRRRVQGRRLRSRGLHALHLCRDPGLCRRGQEGGLDRSRGGGQGAARRQLRDRAGHDRLQREGRRHGAQVRDVHLEGRQLRRDRRLTARHDERREPGLRARFRFAGQPARRFGVLYQRHGRHSERWRLSGRENRQVPIVNRVAEYQDELTAWRRHLHEHPELGFEEDETAGVRGREAARVRGRRGPYRRRRTGVVAVVHGRGRGRPIGLRADMDALPIQEETGLAWSSRTPAGCTPAAMTATPRCCWAPRVTWPRPATSPARST